MALYATLYLEDVTGAAILAEKADSEGDVCSPVGGGTPNIIKPTDILPVRI
jgi:hypothetical protein